MSGETHLCGQRKDAGFKGNKPQMPEFCVYFLHHQGP